MKTKSYADQSETIRSLTEEEIAAVSGGVFNLAALVYWYQHAPRSAFLPPAGRLYPYQVWTNNFLPLNGNFGIV
ncbi:MAG: hypothetical protein JO227_12400 [Acetobacteraceae bacterium]|nr:hypothetical protein [Acetobacteraceae bacterium]